MTPRSAIVLGGGGVTGIAWEIGVLAGLADAGDSLRADAVFGTSAGAFVGAALAAGADPRELFDAPRPDEPVIRRPRLLFLAWAWAVLRARGDPQRIGAGMGAIARRRRPVLGADERLRIVRARRTTDDWPEPLRVTAIDARSGELHAFTRADGAALLDAVGASSAVPGISPPVQIGARLWIDGGMVSSANARLAEGFDEVLVIAPLPRSHGSVPSVHDDVAALAARSSVRLLVPDAASERAIGRNIYDPTRRARAAAAGRAQIDRR